MSRTLLYILIVVSIFSCTHKQRTDNTDTTDSSIVLDSVPAITFDIQQDSVMTRVSIGKFAQEVNIVEVAMINNTSSNILFTSYLKIEYWDGAQWQAFDNRVIEVEVGKTIRPSEQFMLSAFFNREINETVPSGKYRVSKTVTGDTRDYFLCAEFEVEG